jgi:antitoxin component YwqK of YwqJK toxin-antitoxin module
MDKYFKNKELIQNTLLPYFCDETTLRGVNKLFSKLDYEKYNTHIQPHGIIETYYKNTKLLKLRETYKNGKKNGLWESFCENGQLHTKRNFINGIKYGLSEEWYENGQLNSRCIYKNGNFHGYFETWHYDGKSNYTCSFDNGKYNGDYVIY